MSEVSVISAGVSPRLTGDVVPAMLRPVVVLVSVMVCTPLMVSVVMTVVVYFCFREFLYIYLPNGILEGVI